MDKDEFDKSNSDIPTPSDHTFQSKESKVKDIYQNMTPPKIH